VDSGKPAELVLALVKNIGRHESAPRRAVKLVQSLRTLPTIPQMAGAHCEVASMLARDCGCGPGVVAGLGQVFERWDGKGIPGRARAAGISVAVRVVQLAADVELFLRAGGLDAAITVAQERRGGLYDPGLVDVFVRDATAMVATLAAPSLWDAVVHAEPGPAEALSGERLERALRAMAGFADLPCRFMRGHSASVAVLAEAGGQQLGLDVETCTHLRHAGYMHDLGSVGVTTSIWEKVAPLTEGERERIRLHAYFTERMLSRLPAFGALAATASMAHERLDGRGYHRRVPAQALPLPALILAAADVYAALVADRPHRPAWAPLEAVRLMEQEAREGRLDVQAVQAVLAAAGHVAAHRRSLARPRGSLSVRSRCSRSLRWA
jgi:HD-GYP domain-containing protein (c-di-GMP phosphodiesterase class II)